MTDKTKKPAVDIVGGVVLENKEPHPLGLVGYALRPRQKLMRAWHRGVETELHYFNPQNFGKWWVSNKDYAYLFNDTSAAASWLEHFNSMADITNNTYTYTLIND